MKLDRRDHGLVRLIRFHRGHTSVAPSRPLFGWIARCECGHEIHMNGRKREAIVAHNNHVRAVAYKPTVMEQFDDADAAAALAAEKEES